MESGRRRALGCLASLALLFSAVPAAAGSAPAFDLLALAPGTERAEVEAELKRSGLEALPRGKRGLAVEAPVFERVFAFQESYLAFDRQGRLEAVEIHVLPDRGSTGREVLQLYEEVKRELLGRLGPPAWERRQGYARGGEVLEALSRGDLNRYLQWETPHAIRAGIPWREDGEVMISILVTQRPLPRRQTFWGIR